VRDWGAERVASAAGASILQGPGSGPPAGLVARGRAAAAGPGHAGPSGACIDTRELRSGELFVGLAGQRTDGGSHASEALRAGAWGVLVEPAHARAARAAHLGGVVLSHPHPLAAMQSLARAWRSELRDRGAAVLAVTGSAGKTSTKDILAALLSSSARTFASPANHNTEIGLPLALLSAPADSQAVVLEMAMRGPGQIAELTEIAEPDVGVIVNVGPAHLELLGSLEAIAAAKAELIAGLAAGASVVVPAREPLLAPHLRDDVNVLTFGEGGDVSLRGVRLDGSVSIAAQGEEIVLQPSFHQRHNLVNLLAAVAAARALGYEPPARLDVSFSSLRGQRVELAGGVVLIEDCYNANPMSMRAAIDDLAESPASRRVAVLGDMLELGPTAPALHRELGRHARERGVALLVTVGPLAGEIAGAFGGEAHSVADARAAGELAAELLRDGDTVLVKGSRGVGLERVGEILAERRGSAEPPALSGSGSGSAGGGAGRR
jgi:UDP-N-acetylmuramoyl-tripeptide--D-alanyl-D-alanine ligase